MYQRVILITLGASLGIVASLVVDSSGHPAVIALAGACCGVSAAGPLLALFERQPKSFGTRLWTFHGLATLLACAWTAVCFTRKDSELGWNYPYAMRGLSAALAVQAVLALVAYWRLLRWTAESAAGKTGIVFCLAYAAIVGLCVIWVSA